jgi:hypothetical protein
MSKILRQAWDHRLQKTSVEVQMVRNNTNTPARRYLGTHNIAESSAGAAIAAVNPAKPAVATGLLDGALEGQDEDSDGDDDGKDGSNVKLSDEFKNGDTVPESAWLDH